MSMPHNEVKEYFTIPPKLASKYLGGAICTQLLQQVENGHRQAYTQVKIDKINA